MPWIIAIEDKALEKIGARKGYVSKIGKNNRIVIGNHRSLAKEYQRKGLPEKTVEFINSQPHGMRARLIDIKVPKLVELVPPRE